VRRQGLEPRTRGLREGRWFAKGALTARMSLPCARKALIAQSFCGRSSHESFHGDGAAPGVSATECNREPVSCRAVAKLPTLFGHCTSLRPTRNPYVDSLAVAVRDRFSHAEMSTLLLLPLMHSHA
jgi:hypothetical protein